MKKTTAGLVGLLTLLNIGCRTPVDTGVLDSGNDIEDTQETEDTQDTGDTDVIPQNLFPECPTLTDLPEETIDFQISDLDLNIGGKGFYFETQQDREAALFFGPKNSGGECVYGLATGSLNTEHNLTLPLLRMDEDYQAVVGFLDENGELVSRSQVIEFETETQIQSLPTDIVNMGTHSHELGFDVEYFNVDRVPGFFFVGDIITKTIDPNEEYSGSQAFVFDSQGILVGNYLARNSASFFPSLEANFGGEGHASYTNGNKEVRINIGGGVAEQDPTSIISLEGVIEDSIVQPILGDRQYVLSHTHREIDNTSALSNSDSVEPFEGRVFLSLIYEMGQDGAPGTHNAVIYDQARVNSENNQDIDAWAIWRFGSEDLLPEEVAETFYPNSLHYDPVRNEIIVRSKTDLGGGLIFGIDVAEKKINWVFGTHASELEQYLEDVILIDQIEDQGLCDNAFNYGGHHVTTRHDTKNPNDFYLSVHDNGDIENGGTQHTRAMVYRVQLDEVNKTGQINVHWAYPSNLLPEDDPMAERMNYFNSGFGSLTHLGGELYLLASGLTDKAEEDEVHPLGLETRDHIVLLEGIPEEQSAEVLAIYSLREPQNNSIYSIDAGFLFHPSGSLELQDGMYPFEISYIDIDVE